jgi:lipopolysaccharide/colanic/teichoic acid biosynthesis glycosyltransferase
MNLTTDFLSPQALPDSLLRSSTALAKRLLNFCVALIFIVLGLPLLLGISLLVLAIDGRPVIHRGKRFGLHKRPYTMYKFRTLARGATGVLGAELVSCKHRLMIPCGRFLRDTRLDELPQLFNILRGDMNFFGPRPERPEVYDALCSQLEDYDHLFSVKPGLVCYAQLFTPHSSPKRLRTLTDRLAMGHPFQGVLLVACALVAVAGTVARTLSHYVWTDLLLSKILRLYRNRREWVRVRPRDAKVLIDLEDRTIEAPVIDINGEAILLQCPERLPEGGAPIPLRMEVRFQRRQQASSTRRRVARCSGQVLQTRPAPEGCQYVILYRPATAWNQYLIHQYLLRRSLANPFRSLGNGSLGRGVAGEGTTPKLQLSAVGAGRRP